jgi:arabinoxylan arabinofuranohydrolase
MKKQAFNPYLPTWEYIPDGEPYVFGDRVYVYGSHDYYNGHVFCLGDYMCWSAPVDDLADWRCEGVIFPRTADPINADGRMSLFAPDVTVGPDGRYYLYYVYNKVNIVSVAVCDSPAGRYHFLGYVHYKDGTRLGERAGDEPQFDPGVLTEGDRTYLYTGFAGRGDKTRHGSMVTVLDADMVTIIEEPKLVVPGVEYAEGSGFEGHAFFEASSIRKRGDTYFFVYSSTPMHELCYATSKSPLGGFKYGGVIVSNCDLHIDTYKPAEMTVAYGGNNHGSIVEIKGQWYIFYHRQTNGTWYSRQGCVEPIILLPDDSIAQVEITSCGLNGGPLVGRGEYPAYIACHLFTSEPHMMSGTPGLPRVMQDGRDGDPEIGYIGGIYNTTTIGFKYFECKGVKRISIVTRGYADGTFDIKNAWDGPALASITIRYTDHWTKYTADVAFPDGKQALYLTYRGADASALSATALKSITFETCAVE